MNHVPRILVLLGSRTGDNNQALALAEALNLPFETQTLGYNYLQALSVWLGPTVATLDRRTKAGIQPPWPDLIISTGRRSVPAARWIRKQNGGRTKLVRIGHPRIDPAIFDLVVTTRQYPVPRGDNVLLLPIAMSRFSTPPAPTAEEKSWIGTLARPRRLLAIGGATKYWRLTAPGIASAIHFLRELQGSVTVVTSRRTDSDVIESAREALRQDGKLVQGAFPRFPVLMAMADEIFVTGDSVSMLSEAILTGKPVGLVPIEQDDKGSRKLGEVPRDAGPDARRRDLRRFWNYLEDERLIGTIDSPVAASIENPVETAARAVRALLGDLG